MKFSEAKIHGLLLDARRFLEQVMYIVPLAISRSSLHFGYLLAPDPLITIMTHPKQLLNGIPSQLATQLPFSILKPFMTILHAFCQNICTTAPQGNSNIRNV